MSRTRLPWLLVVGGVLLWLVAVLPAYYVVHKPFTEPFAALNPTFDAASVAAAIFGILADLVLLVLTLAVAAAWGSRIQRWLGLGPAEGLGPWTLAAILGLGLLATLTFGLGAVGGLYRWLGYALLPALALAALPELKALLRCLPRRPARPAWAWLLVGGMGLMALVLALLPPTGWDALVYHLQGPRLYLEAHRLIAVPENFYLNWPAQVEMLFTWGMLLKGDTLAKLFHWVFWPLIAFLLYDLTRRTVHARAGRWAVALWAGVPVAAELAGLAYVDLGLTAFVLAAVVAFLRWSETQRAGWLILSALFAGLALATKYTAVTWLLSLGLLLIYDARRRHQRPLPWIAGRTVGYGLLAGLVASPWLIKNWIVTGNPIYPFLFGGVAWNETRAAWLTWVDRGYSRNLLDYLALPWLATVLGRSHSAAFDATIGPLLLCLTPLVLLVRRWPRAVRYGLALAGVQLLQFFVTIYVYAYLTETRLLLPIFPLLCLAAAFGLSRLADWDRPAFRLSWLVRTVAALVLALTLAMETYAFLSARPLAPLLGLEGRDAYLLRRLGAHKAVMDEIDSRLPAGAKLLFLWEPRAYYCAPPALADATLDNLSQLRLAYGRVDAALDALRAAGFSHLLLYRSGMEFLRQPTVPPPTFTSLWRPTEAEESYYPLVEEDLLFLEELLARCQPVGGVGEAYQVYRLP